DVSVTPLDLKDADAGDVQLTFVAKPLAEITGVVKDERGQADPSSNVVIFPVERAAWTNNGLTPRTIRAVGVDAAGRYSATSVPPGEYFVAATSAVGA